MSIQQSIQAQLQNSESTCCIHLYPAHYCTDLILALSSCQPRLRGAVLGSALSTMDSAGLFDASRGRRASQKRSVNLNPDCFPTSKMHCSLPDQQRKDLNELLHKILRLLESKAHPRIICTVRLVKSKTYESRPERLDQIVLSLKDKPDLHSSISTAFNKMKM